MNTSLSKVSLTLLTNFVYDVLIVSTFPSVMRLLDLYIILGFSNVHAKQQYQSDENIGVLLFFPYLLGFWHVSFKQAKHF